jgi:hypothetical protein
MVVLMPIRQPPESSRGPPLFPASRHACNHRLSKFQSDADEAAARFYQEASAVSCKHVSTESKKFCLKMRSQGHSYRQTYNRHSPAGERLTRIDGCICLDDVLDGPATDGSNLTPCAADYSCSERVVQTKGIANSKQLQMQEEQKQQAGDSALTVVKAACD